LASLKRNGASKDLIAFSNILPKLSPKSAWALAERFFSTVHMVSSSYTLEIDLLVNLCEGDWKWLLRNQKLQRCLCLPRLIWFATRPQVDQDVFERVLQHRKDLESLPLGHYFVAICWESNWLDWIQYSGSAERIATWLSRLQRLLPLLHYDHILNAVRRRWGFQNTCADVASLRTLLLTFWPELKDFTAEHYGNAKLFEREYIQLSNETRHRLTQALTSFLFEPVVNIIFGYVMA